MFETLKETWNRIQEDPPGKRFRRQYRRRQNSRESIVNRLFFMGIGLIAFILGIIMIFTPGPGLFFIFVGWGLIAQESLLLAVLLDKLELKLRAWVNWMWDTWKSASAGLKVLLVVVGIAVSAAGIYGAYWFLFAR